MIVRKEVHISDDTIKVLIKLAEKEGRSLKNYMEKVLREHALVEKLKRKTT